jgi:plastocyanin
LNRIVLIIVGIVVVIGVAWLAFMMPKQSKPASPAATGNSSATITYTDNGFEPATTTVKSGQSVIFKNSSSSGIQIDSNPHPVHTDDTDLNVGAIAAGASKIATLTKSGTFGFHNHLQPSNQAHITIQ